MLVPGKVEGNNLIVDLKGLSASQVPLKDLGKLYGVLGHHYIGRVFKFYILNLSGMLSFVAAGAKGLLTDRQKQKLNILSDPAQLREDFALHQLETDHGGTRPLVKEFFPFPMQAGPFEANYSKGPNVNAVKRVDKVFSTAGSRGRLYDPKRPDEENFRQDYSTEAPEILEQCGLPVPPHLIQKVDAMTKRRSIRDEARQQLSIAGTTSLGAEDITGDQVEKGIDPICPPVLELTAVPEVSFESDEDREGETPHFSDDGFSSEEPRLDTTEVQQAGGFSYLFRCGCCVS